MKFYVNHNRLNHRLEHIKQHERKPITSNVAGKSGDKSAAPKVETTKGVKVDNSNPTRNEPERKPNAVTTTSKGSKRS